MGQVIAFLFVFFCVVAHVVQRGALGDVRRDCELDDTVW